MSSTVSDKTLILNSAQVDQKIRRMAFEIYENNSTEKNIVLAGIDGQGYLFAQILAKAVSSISPLSTQIVKVKLDKLAPQQGEVEMDCELDKIMKKCIVLIDDVLNTGRTLAYGMKPFLSTEVKKIEVAVLINRSHTLFPILPQYTGFELSTTLKDHVEVKLGKESSVFLI